MHVDKQTVTLCVEIFNSNTRHISLVVTGLCLQTSGLLPVSYTHLTLPTNIAV